MTALPQAVAEAGAQAGALAASLTPPESNPVKVEKSADTAANAKSYSQQYAELANHEKTNGAFSQPEYDEELALCRSKNYCKSPRTRAAARVGHFV